MNFKNSAISMILLSLLWVVPGASAQESDRRDSYILPSISNGTQPDPEVMSVAYYCYSYTTGAARECSLRFFFLSTVDEAVRLGIKTAHCEYDAAGELVPGTCANGGHAHSIGATATRPFTRIYTTPTTENLKDQNADQQLQRQTSLTFKDTITSGYPNFEVSGAFVTDKWAVVEYQAPDAAGSAYWASQIDPPPCFFLPRFCGFVGRGAQADGSMLMDGTVTYRIRGLRQLPELPDLYQKVRGGHPNRNDPEDSRHKHEHAFAGTQRAIDAMRLIAWRYKIATENRLRPNDMSLPMGGLFDVEAGYDWLVGGHSTHREGLDIDLNRSVQLKNGGDSLPIQCENDRDTFEAVNAVLLPVVGRVPRRRTDEDVGFIMGTGGTLPEKATALLCETNNSRVPPGEEVFGRKHIDITQIIFPKDTS